MLSQMFTGKAKYASIMQWHFYTFENLRSSLVSSLGLITLISYYDLHFKVIISQIPACFSCFLLD